MPKNVKVSMQISIADHVAKLKEDAIEDWSYWRDANYESEEHKQWVDDVFDEYIRTLDSLLEGLVPF